jgi:DNA-binding MarR family transcriptional regulator
VSDPTSTTALAEQLVSAANLFTVLLRDALRSSGTSLSQACALSALFAHEPQRITALAASQQVSQPAMTSLVNNLERKGLVTRTLAPDDRRAVEVTLTHAGRELMQSVRLARVATVERHLATLSPDRYATLAEGVSALRSLNETLRRDRNQPS